MTSNFLLTVSKNDCDYEMVMIISHKIEDNTSLFVLDQVPSLQHQSSWSVEWNVDQHTLCYQGSTAGKAVQSPQPQHNICVRFSRNDQAISLQHLEGICNKG